MWRYVKTPNCDSGVEQQKAALVYIDDLVCLNDGGEFKESFKRFIQMNYN